MRGSLADMKWGEDAPAPGAAHKDRVSGHHVWAVLLAGGDGTRLLGTSVAGERVDRPKQFCSFGRDDSLLGSTLLRARRVADPSRILPVVSEQHRAWWKPELTHLPEENVLVQPRNRGTAVAILHALVEILRRDDDPTIVVLPCDHGVDDEAPLIAAMGHAIRAAAHPDQPLVLLGVSPASPEPQYGWIVPARGDGERSRPVRRFEEKPSLRDACGLMEQGGLWNSFIFAASGRALLTLYLRTVLRLVEAYLWRMPEWRWTREALEACFASLPFTDFSRDILERSVPHLRVVPMKGTGWTDLGTPHRLEAWLARQRRRASPAREASPMRLLTP